MNLNSPLEGLPLAVFDVETTGLSPRGDHIVQIAVVHGTFTRDPAAPKPHEVIVSTLVKPPISIPAESSRIHGISDADVADAPTIAEVLPDVLAALTGRIRVAFNFPFDHQFLNAAFAAAGMRELAFFGLDPLVWSRRIGYFEGEPTRKNRLSDVCDRYGIRLDGAHDASVDCVATIEAIPHLFRDFDQNLRRGELVAIQTLRHLWEMQLAAAKKEQAFLMRRSETWSNPITDCPWTELTEVTS